MDEAEIRARASRVAARSLNRVALSSLTEEEAATESRPGLFGLLRREAQVTTSKLLIEGWCLWSLALENEELRSVDPPRVSRKEDLTAYLYLQTSGQIIYASRECKMFFPERRPQYATRSWFEEPRVATMLDIGQPEIKRKSFRQTSIVANGMVKEQWGQRGAWHDDNRTKGETVVRALTQLNAL